MFELFNHAGSLVASGSASAEEAGHATAEAAHHGGGPTIEPSFMGLMFYIVLVVAILMGLMHVAKKDFGSKFFTNKWAQRFEQLYLFVEQLCVGIIGPHGRQFMPMVFTFWVMIFSSNVLALFMPTAPSAILGFNMGMALIAIGYVQYAGMKANGILGHFSHFAGPKLGGFMAFTITPMIFLIEIISETMKNVSLSLRLFGNIFGGHEAVHAMNELTRSVFIPAGAFLMPIKILTCVVQALIFCLLFCVYLSLVTHHEEHGHEQGHDHTGQEPAHA